MRVQLIKRKTFESYVLKHASSKSSFSLWLRIVSTADWKRPEEIGETFGSADYIGEGRIVSNPEYAVENLFHVQTPLSLSLC